MGWAAKAASSVMARCCGERRRGAVMDGGGRHQADPAVAVFVVVPAEELLAVSASVLDRAEALGEVGSVLQGFELRLGVRIVIRDVRTAVGLGDLQIDQSAATGLDRMLVPRSACSVRVPGAMFSFSRVSAMSCSASSADSRCATIQPTT